MYLSNLTKVNAFFCVRPNLIPKKIKKNKFSVKEFEEIREKYYPFLTFDELFAKLINQ